MIDDHNNNDKGSIGGICCLSDFSGAVEPRDDGLCIAKMAPAGARADANADELDDRDLVALYVSRLKWSLV